MRKLTAIVFLFSFLLATTELYQLLKLPQLVAHYIEHRKEDRSLSMLAFLSLHYAQGDVRDADYEQDMKLPFKTCDSTPHAASFVCLPEPPGHFNPTPVLLIDRQKPVDLNLYLPSSYKASIWQPPRHC